MDTGEILKTHSFTTASVESLQIAILAKVLDNHPYGQYIYKKEEALSLLTTKMNAYESFNTNYPGFGGFLPELYFNPNPSPAGNSVSSLENGELFWAIYGLVQVLEVR